MSKELFKRTTLEKVEQATVEVTDALARGGVPAIDEKRAAGMLALALTDLKTRYTPEDLSFIIEHHLQMVQPAAPVGATQQLSNEDLVAAYEESKDALAEGGLGKIGLEQSQALLVLAIRQLLAIYSAETLRRKIEILRDVVPTAPLLGKEDLN